MYKILAVIGKAGSGKDYLVRAFLNQAGLNKDLFHQKISHTTRPKREGEREGVDYFYVTDEQFHSEEKFEQACFNGWWYGTGMDGLKEDKINIGIFNPAGVRQLVNHPKVDARVIYIDCSDKNRMMRQLSREKDPNVNEIVRRYNADNLDFDNLEFNYTLINNDREPYFALTQLVAQVQDWVAQGQK